MLIIPYSSSSSHRRCFRRLLSLRVCTFSLMVDWYPIWTLLSEISISFYRLSVKVSRHKGSVYISAKVSIGSPFFDRSRRSWILVMNCTPIARQLFRSHYPRYLPGGFASGIPSLVLSSSTPGAVTPPHWIDGSQQQRSRALDWECTASNSFI